VAADNCPACPGQRRTIAVAVAYPPMRRMITEFLERDDECWCATPTTVDDLSGEIERDRPDVVIVDAADFPRCCRAEFGGFPAARVVVVSPEPDHAYRAAALREGAGAWVSADAVGDELSAHLRAVFACEHGPSTWPVL
jgi:DNA-binding NarL/FixJ family response regulator